MASSSLRTLSNCSKLAGTRRAGATALRTYATSASSSSQGAEYSVTSSSEGVKVASLDEGLPTSAITVAVKAGPRYEPSPGLAHVLKNFVFKSTSKRSALRITRETELLGGVLSASLSREHLFLTAECLRGDEPYFAEILGDAITQSQFKAHEYTEEVVPAVAAEYEAASHNASVLAMDFAHQLAFRRGLGNSLFASPFLEVDAQSAIAFGRSSFANTNGIAVLSNSSLSSGMLKDLVSEFYTGVQAPASSSSPAANLTSTDKAKYYGGETRVPMTGHGHGSTGHFLLALQGGSHSAPEYAVLKALLGGEAATKWGVGTQPFAKLSNVSTYVPSVRAVNLQYSDTGLFGFTVDAKTSEIASLAKQAVAAMKEVADKGVKDEEFKRAVAKAKFEAATSLEGRVTKQEVIGAQILESSKITSLADAWKALESVSPSKVQEAAKAALKSKPTTVAVGDTHKLPYADELGL